MELAVRGQPTQCQEGKLWRVLSTSSFSYCLFRQHGLPQVQFSLEFRLQNIHKCVLLTKRQTKYLRQYHSVLTTDPSTIHNLFHFRFTNKFTTTKKFSDFSSTSAIWFQIVQNLTWLDETSKSSERQRRRREGDQRRRRVAEGLKAISVGVVSLKTSSVLLRPLVTGERALWEGESDEKLGFSEKATWEEEGRVGWDRPSRERERENMVLGLSAK